MSHSSGIPVGSNLKETFGNALTSNSVRLIKVQIENEQLVDISSKNIHGSFDDDLSMVPDLLDKEKPCYVIYRMDTEDPQWTLFCYVPDKSKVKEKMLYASTRANLKQQLGLNYFIDDVFGTVPGDFTKEGYKLHVECKKMEAPLTQQEQIKQLELESGEIYKGGASSYVHGVAFPVQSDAVDALKKLVSGSVNYVQIVIDCDAEKIKCGHTNNLKSFGDLKKEIRLDEPRFHFYAYKHNHEGSSITSFVYVYSCPDGSKGTKSAPVRMRMLYSSSKANVADIIKTVNGNIDAKLEINAPEDLIEDDVVTTLHPPQAEQTKTFSKPTRPGKGGARLVRKT
jgi:twinfilin-like protein